MTIREIRVYAASERQFGGVHSMPMSEAAKYTRAKGRNLSENAGPKKWMDIVEGQAALYRKIQGVDPPADLVQKWRDEEKKKQEKREAVRRLQEQKRRGAEMLRGRG